MRFGAVTFVATPLFAAALVLTVWIAVPTEDNLNLPSPLQAWKASDRALVEGPYNKDFDVLSRAFQSQVYRSFCGPASLSTVLRAYGVLGADQRSIFPSLQTKYDAFFTGMSLSELAFLAEQTGLKIELRFADALSLETFRDTLKNNLARGGDFVVINYDRRILKQSGAGHISPVGAYDEERDAFLVLDQAAYKYPFTWVPTPLLYRAMHSRDGQRYRGILLIRSYKSDRRPT